jgi:hypothetical protein
MYKVGSAPWETKQQSFPVGQAPWETGATDTSVKLEPQGLLRSLVPRGVFKIASSIRSIPEIIRADSNAEADLAMQRQYNYGKFGSESPLQNPVESIAAGASIGATAASFGTGVARTVIGKAAQFGALSAVGTAGESTLQGNNASQVAKDTFYAGLTGGFVGGATGVIGNTFKKVVSKAPESIYNNALKVTQRLKQADKSPAKFLADKGIWGSLGTFKKAADEGMEVADKAISSKVAKVSGGATFGEIKKVASENLKKDLGSGLFSDGAIKELIDAVPMERFKTSKILNWKSIDEVRSQLGRLIGDNKWIASNPSEKVKAYQAMYRSMASLLQKTTKTEKEFAQYTKWIQTKKAVDRAIDLADSKIGLGLFDIVSGGVGFASGDNLSDRLKNAASFAVGQRLARSTRVQTGVAQLLKKLSSIQPDKTGRVGKTTVINMINQHFANQ